MNFFKGGVSLVLAFAGAAFAADAASAGQFGSRGARAHYDDGEIITAESRYGNGAISAPVRRGRNGWDVRLPRGTWIGCRRSCEETLRVETVDVFEAHEQLSGYGTLQNQCGIFGCLEITLPR